jgi:PAS domain S-box-containing protein
MDEGIHQDTLPNAHGALEAILSAISDPLFLLNPEGTILTCNESAASQLGRSKCDLVGASVFDSLEASASAEQREQLKAQISETLSSAKPVSFTQERDGLVWENTVSPVLDGGEQVTRVVLSIHDRTREARAQHALQKADEKYHRLMESIRDSVGILDIDGKVLFLNTTAARQLGGKSDDYVGKGLRDVLPHPIADRLLGHIRDAIAVASPSQVLDRVVFAGRSYDVTITPLMDGAGRAAACTILAKDITDYDEALKEQHQHNGRIRHCGQLASLAMSGVSLAQELAQSLSVIRLAEHNALAELKTRGRLDTIKQDLDLSFKASEAMTATINRFRSLARQWTKTRKRTVRIDQVAAWTFRLLAYAAEKARLAFRTEGLEALPEIQMEENALEQVFLTLAENSVQAAGGSRDYCLSIAGTFEDGRIVLRFQDDCGGIEPANLPRVFDPFFTTRPLSGEAGGELYVAREIVRHRGGDISVESRRNEGTTFIVTLPVAESVHAGAVGHPFAAERGG